MCFSAACDNECVKKRNRKIPSLKSLLPRGKHARRRVELLGGAAATGLAVLVVSVFLISSIDRFLVSSNQYASVLAGVLVDLANGDRAQNDLHTLTMNPVLVAAAQAKADDMAAKGYFAHVSPEGVEPWHWFEKAGYNFDYAGENLAVDFSDSGDVERAWMNSPTHRDNILNDHFTEIGIATAEGSYQGHPTTFVVQEFGSPSDSTASARVSEANVPENPTETAIATSIAGESVLGEATGQPSATPPPKKTEILGSSAGAKQPTNIPVKTIAENAAPDYAPFWAHIATSPRSILQYAYWVLALLIIIALGVTTGFELHIHHIRKALAAGGLLVFMLVLFLAADTFVFTTPTLTPQATMTASAAASF